MATQRMNSFDVPHKGIRNGLSQLSLLAGKTDYENANEIESLFKLGKEVFTILTTHANDENDVSLKALEERLEGASQHDVGEHIRIHKVQSRLETLLTDIYGSAQAGRNVPDQGREFYNLLSDFHADYLRHMTEEEQETQALLWRYFSDEELAAHRTEIMKKLSPDTLLLWLKFIVPAQSHKERVGLLTGFKDNAPAEFYQQAMFLIKSVLPSTEWELLNNALHI